MSTDHVKYDSHFIQEFADRLYSESDRAVMQTTVTAAFLGVIAGLVIAALTHIQTTGFVSVCTVLAGCIGYVRGREKVFTLKLQAQQALCQMYTEKNTRFLAVSISQRSGASVQLSGRQAEQAAASS